MFKSRSPQDFALKVNWALDNREQLVRHLSKLAAGSPGQELLDMYRRLATR